MPDIQFRTNESQDLSSHWSSPKAAAGNMGLSIDDFYKILAAQLRYQDADNPMDTSEMMAQMVQTQMISTINQMNQISMITYASSMIGKEVTVGLLDEFGWPNGETVTGVVTGTYLYGDTPVIIVDGVGYSVSQVTMLGNAKTEQKPEEPGDDGDGDGSDVPGAEGGNGDNDGTPPVDGAGDGDGTPPVDGGGDGDTDPSTGNEGNSEP